MMHPPFNEETQEPKDRLENTENFPTKKPKIS